MTTLNTPRQPVGLKQFRGDGCVSYCLSDSATRQAAVIDPTVGLMQDYRAYLAEQGLVPVLALDTHTHADHFSASHLIRQEYGAEVGMSRRTSSRRATRKLGAGDLLEVGSLRLKVLETPGHTPDSLSFLLEAGRAKLVFTGDTLFIGSTGRTDFPGADPGEQWDSIHGVLGALPDETLVFPGHEYSGYLFSTIGTEKRKNPHWLIPSRDLFIEMKKAECIAQQPDEIRRRVDFNLESDPSRDTGALTGGAATACGTASNREDRVGAINAEKYRAKVESPSASFAYVDVRETDEFAEGHIPGTVNLPLSELGLAWSEIKKTQRVYISCLSGGRSSMAAATLSYLGHPDVVNVTGGFRAWSQAGLPVHQG